MNESQERVTIARQSTQLLQLTISLPTVTTYIPSLSPAKNFSFWCTGTSSFRSIKCFIKILFYTLKKILRIAIKLLFKIFRTVYRSLHWLTHYHMVIETKSFNKLIIMSVHLHKNNDVLQLHLLLNLMLSRDHFKRSIQFCSLFRSGILHV